MRENAPYEYRAIRADTGEQIWVEAEGQAVFEQVEGRIVATRYIGTIKDVTGSKIQHLALEESERRLRLAMDAARMAVWEFTVAASRFTSSEQLKRIFGFPVDTEPTFEEYRDVHLPGEYEKVQLVAQQALASGERHFEVEYQIRRADGADRWLLLRAEMLLGAAGTPERIVGVVVDINDQKRASERQQLLVQELEPSGEKLACSRYRACKPNVSRRSDCACPFGLRRKVKSTVGRQRYSSRKRLEGLQPVPLARTRNKLSTYGLLLWQSGR